MAGKAPITNILEALQPAFPEIANTAHVDKILGEPPPAGARVEIVDVTDLIVDWLHADERTKSIIRQLRNQQK